MLMPWEVGVMMILVAILGYCVGRMNGWVYGYNKCSLEAKAWFEDYIKREGWKGK